MTKYILTVALVILCAAAAFAQRTETSGSASATGATSAEALGKAVNLQSGTRLAAQLQSTLDVRKARVGDQVVLKTTEAIKSNGRTVVNKGARLIGRVTEVQQKTRANGESSLSLVFDRLESGSLEAPINATITSITGVASRTRAGDDGINSNTRTQSSSSGRASSSSRQSSGGGLLGGVSNTVGGIVNTTTQTAGNVVGGTTSAAGETVGNVTETVGGIRITQSADASIEGGSTLSLTGDNLRLEKGTAFNLRLNQATSVGGNN